MSKPVVLRGAAAIPFAALSSDDVRRIGDALSVQNPARIQAERLGDANAWRHPERVGLLAEVDGHAIVPIVRRDLWAPFARRVGVQDERPVFDAAQLPFRGELFDFQERVVSAMAAVPYGGLVAPPGAGKGEKVAALVGRAGLPTLVVVGQLDLAEDLASRLPARLGVTVGRIGAGTFDVQRITVATAQSLTPDVLHRIRDAFGVLVVDEAHHAAAPSYLAISSSLSVRRRYWFTATPRADGLGPFVEWTMGPVIATVTRRELEAAGRATTPTLERIETDFSFDYGSRDDWAGLLDALVTDAARNRQIVAEMVRRCRGGVLGAVITGRVAHAETLGELLRAAGLRAGVLTGSASKKARTAILAAARAGELDVIVGTQVFDEGIDVPNLSVVALVFPQRHEGRLTQRIGRALRVHAGKPAPVILDFVDDVGPLRHQARARARVFAEQWGTAAQMEAA